MDLTYKQRLFVAAYLGKANGNATEAARMAGYGTPRQSGARALSNVVIRAAIDAHLAQAAMSADEVLARLSEMAATDIGDYISINDDGSFRIDLSRAKKTRRTRSIRKVKTITKTFTSDQGESVETRCELELHDQQAALDKLARYHGLYDGKPKVDDTRDKPRIIIPGSPAAPEGGPKAKGGSRKRKPS